MARQRRTLLHVAAGVGVGFAGCSSTQDPEGSNTETPTDSPALNPTAQDIYVVIHNNLSREVSVTVELSTAQSVLVDDDVTIEPSRYTSLETGIDETNQFDLTVAVDDREKEIAFAIDEYDLEMGSNIVFWIDEDTIRYGIED